LFFGFQQGVGVATFRFMLPRGRSWVREALGGYRQRYEQSLGVEGLIDFEGRRIPELDVI
jgi:hypothetical protein